MAGTFVIDTHSTFATAIFMSSSPKLKFGSKTGEQETSPTGLGKWAVEVAVTFHGINGMRPISEVISLTAEGAQDPANGIAPGTMVVFDGMRVGISAPEKNEKGGIRGGKPWYQVGSIRPAQAPARSKGEAA